MLRVNYDASNAFKNYIAVELVYKDIPEIDTWSTIKIVFIFSPEMKTLLLETFILTQQHLEKSFDCRVIIIVMNIIIPPQNLYWKLKNFY